MDASTLDFYDQNAAQTCAQYREARPAFMNRIKEFFPQPRSKILEVGCGSGRDLASLLSLGYDAFGVEPSEGMRNQAVEAFPELCERILDCALPIPDDARLPGPFDGILCIAVFMHVPEAEAFDAAFSLRRLLADRGRLLLSVPSERSDVGASGRDAGGRLYRVQPAGEVRLLFERLGFECLRQWHEADSLRRPGIGWHMFLFELCSSLAAGPLDRIEQVLNRDRKTATYKLALFRALSEIAILDYRRTRWASEKEVAVPIRLIAEKWFRYYWPIFESAEFIPQNNGETPGSAKPIAFRRLQSRLVNAYRHRGGLGQFLDDRDSEALPQEVEPLYRETITRIVEAIRTGPVVYATGNMFRYDPASRCVLVAADAWREFSQLGHWIEPAVVLRWASETSRMSDGDLPVSEVLDLLLVAPVKDRDVMPARRAFDRLPERACVWSDRPLRADYAIDHVIPFSL